MQKPDTSKYKTRTNMPERIAVFFMRGKACSTATPFLRAAKTSQKLSMPVNAKQTLGAEVTNALRSGTAAGVAYLNCRVSPKK